ncbi:MAG: GDSL-type esterase/lipase family protein [Hyphomonas sp.]|uniref:GDSL-type esterase/lipase family protein n=1 Tax=Hyphomonas sp. TaxID=87 RepID=UPI0034A09A91
MSRSPRDTAPPAECSDKIRGFSSSKGLVVPTHSNDAAKHFRARIKQFAETPLPQGQLVMLGDSLIELNDWSVSSPGSVELQNRGISGDTSDGILFRISEVSESYPRAVFILIGTNDLWTRNSPSKTACNIVAAAKLIRTSSPDTKVFVQTVFPQNWAPASNDRVRSVNALLKESSADSGFVIVDTYAVMVDETGNLNPAFTNDGLHLNEAGYTVWSSMISETMRLHGLIE